MSAARVNADALRIAIIGAGPAGLYAAADLLSRDGAATVDLFERLPVPGGLARYGVAPDHGDRRQVIEHYARLAVASGRFRLHANVEIGRHVTHAELLRHFHAVIYSSGATQDRRLGVPGEDLPGSHSATEFVGWYNGHPDFADRHFALDSERAIVVGNGNVALDVARILLSNSERLRDTDVADHALDALARSGIREVVVLGRRGPAQASFTVPELVELGTLDEIDVAVESPSEALADDGAASRPLRLMLLRELAGRGRLGRARRLVLRFLTSPVDLVGTERLTGVRLVRNHLVREADGTVRTRPTGEVETMSAGLVLRSIGYRATPLASLPFDESTATVPNRHGRVTCDVGGEPLVGVYVAGWLKRGPQGFIGTNKACAQQTVSAILDDAANGHLPAPAASRQDFDGLLDGRQTDVVDYAAWKRIERAEIRLGSESGRPRRRLANWGELLAAAR